MLCVVCSVGHQFSSYEMCVLSLICLSAISAAQAEDYVIAMVKGNRVDVLFGETPGWFQLGSNQPEYFRPYSKMNFPVEERFAITSGIENKAFHVYTHDPDPSVFSYHEFMQYSPLPISALGTKYVVSSCHPPSNYTSILVIATHNQKTDVDITFRLNGSVFYGGKTYGDDDTLTLSLGTNQTFTITSNSDLTGSVINTAEPVAVFSGTLYQMTPNTDYTVAYEQLLPVRHHGEEYVVAVDDNTDLYQLQVVSVYSDTRIMFHNGSSVSVGKNGCYRQYLGFNESFYFNTTKPVMTTLCRQSEFKSGFLVVPPISSYREQSAVSMHANQTAKVMIEQDNAEVNVRTFPGSNHMTEWQGIPGTRFQVGTIFSLGSSSYYISSNTGMFAVLVYRPFYIYNGGYNVTAEIFTTEDEGDNNIIGIVAAGTGVSVATAMAYGGFLFFRRRKRKRDDDEEGQEEEKKKLNVFDPKDRRRHPPPGDAPPLVRI